MTKNNKDWKNTNDRQKQFYDTKRKNFATKLWSNLRNGLLHKIRSNLRIQEQIYDLHRSWFGELSNKKVLDLGCFSGNALSLHLAENSREYIGIDLSEKGISILRERLKPFPQATAVEMDFLSQNFKERDFDLIYAYGVLHHFRNVDELILKLNEKLKINGEVISYDPLQTNLPLKIMRKIYRPFQTDKDWEWPFSKKTYFQFQEAFKIKERRAVLGKAKWFFVVNLMPISAKKKISLGAKWHGEDWKRSSESDSYMFDCMHLTMLMQKKN